MAVRHKVVKVESCFADGMTATRSVIEISLSPGIPTFDITGLCDSSIRESRGRITSAIRSMGFLMPKGHITVSISPAYMHKSGSGFDLPIAMGILFISDVIPYFDNVRVYAQGELSLAGDVKASPLAGLRLCEEARDPADMVFIPEEEIGAAAAAGTACMPVNTLQDVVDVLNSFAYMQETFEPELDFGKPRVIHHLSDLKGQPKAQEAIVTACAGMHSLLLLGSPGSGKTMAAGIIEDLMPPLTEDEARQYMMLTENENDQRDGVMSLARPVRHIYGNCSISKLTGRAGSMVPGELALANNGVLFADEITDLDPKIIDALKLPLEEHLVRMTKDNVTRELPASFLFVAAGNPCRCGLYYENGSKCRCTSVMRRKYLSKLSGGFLDRIDIFTEMRSVKAKDLQDITGGISRHETEEDREARRRIATAWEMQKKRYCWTEGITKVYNGTCERTDMNLFKFSPELSAFASEAAIGMGLSARGFKNLMRVSRTIADMKGAEEITLPDVKQALMYKVRLDGI